MTTKTPPKNTLPYQKPGIAHRGQLKQFAGSPLGKLIDGNPLNLPGKD